MTDDYLNKLNPEQRAAVEYVDGPELVIAGAGSGKTRVLTYKIVHLLNLGVRPERILALTFTNKAAEEMRSRISSLVSASEASRLWMGTFHSIFARILRINAEKIGFNSHFTIYDDYDSKSLIRSIIKELKLDDKIYRPAKVANDISAAKNELITAKEYASSTNPVCREAMHERPLLTKIYSIYAERCRISNALDFDDLLLYTYLLLKNNPEVLEYYQSYFSYILVDEYQDTNSAQHKIAMMLAKQSGKLCVVGDDAQSIYSFRGARIRNILSLEQQFSNLKLFKLERNYRSTKRIIGAANTLIAKNTEQIRKDVYSQNADGDKIEVVCCFNDYEEAYAVVNKLTQLRMRHNLALNDFAILYRINVQSRILEEALRNRNVAYRIYGGLAFYQRKEVKDVVSYFRLSVNPHDDEAFRRVINTPKRGIGDTTVKKLVTAAVDNSESLYNVAKDPKRFGIDINAGTVKKLQNFTALIDYYIHLNAQEMDAGTLANEIINSSHLTDEYKSDATPENVSKLENITELLNATNQFSARTEETQGEGAALMADFLAEVSLLSDQDRDDNDGDCVTLMTIHAAKGLEFEGVFVVGVEEELLPSGRCFEDSSQIQEERRLMYVAITRAKRFCMLSFTRQRILNGQTTYPRESRFIYDINPEYLYLSRGTKLNFNRSSRTAIHPARPSVSTRVEAPAPTRHISFGIAPVSKQVNPEASEEFPLHSSSELYVGMKIVHKQFGSGTILKIDTVAVDNRIEAEFAVGKKVLLLKFARFKIV